MEFTFHGFQDNWTILRGKKGYEIERYFDFEIENVEQDEMRVGKYIVNVKNGTVDWEFFNDEYDYESVKEDVLSSYNLDDIMDSAKKIIQDLEVINNQDMPIIEETMQVKEFLRKKYYHCSFQFDGVLRPFTVIFVEKKISDLFTHDTDKSNFEEFTVTDLLDSEKITDYFYHQSKERLRLLLSITPT